MDKELLLIIEIPNYIRKIKLSDSRRATYWLRNKVLAGNQNLPLKYLTQIPEPKIGSKPIEAFMRVNKKGFHQWFIINKDVCYWKEYKKSKNKSEWRLADDTTDEYIIKNTKVAGTENWYVINSQNIYSGNMHPNVRNKVVDAIHSQIFDCINKQILQGSSFQILQDYPVRVLMELHDYIEDEITKTTDWDLDNRCYIWGKCFMDSIVKAGIIPEDHRAYVSQPPVPLFCPLLPKNEEWKADFGEENIGEPKLIFKIYADRRTGIKELLKPYRKGRKIKKSNR